MTTSSRVRTITRTSRGWGWLARRCVLAVFMLLIVSILIFCATQALPGDVALIVLGKEASADQLTMVREQLNLDQPLAIQYIRWLTDLLQGNFGTSIVSRVGVADLLIPRIANSFFLVVASMAIAVPASLVLGVLTATRKDGFADKAIMAVSIMVNALPEFVLGLFLVLLLSTSVFHFFPAVSLLSPGTSIWAQTERLAMPIITLVLLQVTYLYRLVRGTVIDVLQTEYIQFATLKGLSPSRILFRHVLPNALVPALQAAGTVFAFSVGGVVVIEYVFGFPGLGTALADAVGMRDIPVVQASVLAISVTFFVVNIITDGFSVMLTPPGRGGRN